MGNRRTAMPLAVIALVLGVLAFGLWYQGRHPREIVGTGSIRVIRASAVTTHATRTVSINGARFQEVEMPNGTWIACANDCPRAVRESAEDFWKVHEQNRR